MRQTSIDDGMGDGERDERLRARTRRYPDVGIQSGQRPIWRHPGERPERVVHPALPGSAVRGREFHVRDPGFEEFRAERENEVGAIESVARDLRASERNRAGTAQRLEIK